MLPPVRSGHETRTENRTTERFNLNCPEINGNGSRRCGRAESVCGDIGDKNATRRGMVVDKRERENQQRIRSPMGWQTTPLPFPPGAGRLEMVWSKGAEGNSTQLRMPKEYQLDLALDCQSRDRWFKSNGERWKSYLYPSSYLIFLFTARKVILTHFLEKSVLTFSLYKNGIPKMFKRLNFSICFFNLHNYDILKIYL